jgi:hypothetical protein
MKYKLLTNEFGNNNTFAKFPVEFILYTSLNGILILIIPVTLLFSITLERFGID